MAMASRSSSEERSRAEPTKSERAADGRFALVNVPIGTREIEILGIGVQPIAAAADVTTRDTAFVAVEVREDPRATGGSSDGPDRASAFARRVRRA